MELLFFSFLHLSKILIPSEYHRITTKPKHAFFSQFTFVPGNSSFPAYCTVNRFTNYPGLDARLTCKKTTFTMENYWTHQNSVCMCMADLCQYAHLNVKVSLNYMRFLQELSAAIRPVFWSREKTCLWNISGLEKCSPQNVRAKTNFHFLVLNYEYELTIQN